jgi:hypothetical protein
MIADCIAGHVASFSCSHSKNLYVKAILELIQRWLNWHLHMINP